MRTLKATTTLMVSAALAFALACGASKNDPGPNPNPEPSIVTVGMALQAAPSGGWKAETEYTAETWGTWKETPSSATAQLPQDTVWRIQTMVDNALREDVTFVADGYNETTKRFKWKFTPPVAGTYTIVATAKCAGVEKAANEVRVTIGAAPEIQRLSIDYTATKWEIVGFGQFSFDRPISGARIFLSVSAYYTNHAWRKIEPNEATWEWSAQIRDGDTWKPVDVQFQILDIDPFAIMPGSEQWSGEYWSFEVPEHYSSIGHWRVRVKMTLGGKTYTSPPLSCWDSQSGDAGCGSTFTIAR